MTAPQTTWAIDSIAGFQSIWNPHAGCAVLAGQALLEEQLIAPEARPYVQSLVDAIMRDNPLLHSASSGSTTFASREDFLTVLAQDAPAICELGHDWIFSSYVLAATSTHPDLDEASIWNSMNRLVSAIRSADPGYVTINGVNTVLPAPDQAGVEPLDLQTPDDILACFANFSRSARMEKNDMQLGHILTHGHAIYRLRQMGFHDLAKSAASSLEARLSLLTDANTLETEFTPFELFSLDPADASFWKIAQEKSPRQPDHLLKYTYSFLDLRKNCSLPRAKLTSAFFRILCSLEQ